MKNMKQAMSGPDLLMQRLALWTAVAEMINGTARNEEWSEIGDAVNMVEALCTMGKLPDSTMHWVTGAIRGLVDAAKRENGLKRMPAADTVCMRHVATLYDDALCKFARITLVEAKTRVLRKIELSRLDPDCGLIVVGA